MKYKSMGNVNGSPRPEAWIAVSNNRQKKYGKNGRLENLVYLDNGKEFQIELYNPTSISYLAKIYLNENLISNSGLVLKPGQRYFLDRYLDEKKKFLFSTYQVEGTAEAKEAIKNNGKVKVEFYPENISSNWYTTSTAQNRTLQNPLIYGGITTGNSYFTNNSTLGNSSSTIFTNTLNLSGVINCSSTGSLETGRVERGGNSNQDFGTDSGSYSWYFSYTSEYQILPRSVKPLEVEEIRSYCTSCGIRIKKKTWKFCPSCGNKLD